MAQYTPAGGHVTQTAPEPPSEYCVSAHFEQKTPLGSEPAGHPSSVAVNVSGASEGIVRPPSRQLMTNGCVEPCNAETMSVLMTTLPLPSAAPDAPRKNRSPDEEAVDVAGLTTQVTAAADSPAGKPSAEQAGPAAE